MVCFIRLPVNRYRYIFIIQDREKLYININAPILPTKQVHWRQILYIHRFPMSHHWILQTILISEPEFWNCNRMLTYRQKDFRLYKVLYK